MNLAAEFAREIVGYVAMGPRVWRVRRVNSDLLRRQGHAHLEGSEAYRRVQETIKRERTEKLVARGDHPSEEARAAAVAKVGEVERQRAQQRLEALLATPESQAALLARCDAYLCASVDACALLETPLEFPRRFEAEPPLATPWKAWTWVIAEGDDDPESSGRVHVGYLPEAARQLLGLAVQGLQEGLTRRRVETFSAGPVPAASLAPAGSDVPHDAVEGPAVEP